MTKRALILEIVGATLVVLAIAFFWAFDPILTPIFWMSRPGETDADIVRQIWHFRLVQPEWLSGPNQLIRWQQAEVYARLAVVFVGWLVSVIALVTRYFRGRRRHLTGRSSQPLAVV